jgi:hypothetical protein
MIQIGSSHADPAKSCRFARTRIRNTAFHESVVLLQKQLYYGTSPLDGKKAGLALKNPPKKPTQKTQKNPTKKTR